MQASNACVREPDANEQGLQSSAKRVKADHLTYETSNLPASSAGATVEDMDAGKGPVGKTSELTVQEEVRWENAALAAWHLHRQAWRNYQTPPGSRPAPRTRVLGTLVPLESVLNLNQRYPVPIPVAELVEFLVAEWEQEGLYD
eukprot:jgi/Mesvir1/7452/Mv19227-RA.1